ncbi:MAG: dockerin type I repeat-containing protein [Oscillospiraceae bacterium]|nr:dockerin type I repeat-containing protein [Oscillospiraceae bacterium]
MKKTIRKLLASVLSLSLMATSLPVIGSTTAFAAESTEPVITYPAPTWRELEFPLGRVLTHGESKYEDTIVFAYYNEETETSFVYRSIDVPFIVRMLLIDDHAFDGEHVLLEKFMKVLSFSDAEIKEEYLHYVGRDEPDPVVYRVMNHGAITYTDEAGEAHTFTCAKDIEDYLIQNYPVIPVDFHKIEKGSLSLNSYYSGITFDNMEEVKEYVADGFPLMESKETTTTTTDSEPTKEERDMTTQIGRVINPEGSNYATSSLSLHYNEETETAFVFCGQDVPFYMKALIVEPTIFDGMVNYTEAIMQYFYFPDADIKVFNAAGEDTYFVENHGTIIYTDEDGEKHTFTCMKDAEDYVMQNYPVIPLDFHKIKEDTFSSCKDITFDSMEAVREYAIQNFPVLDTSKTDITTNVPTNILLGDITMDGKVDLMDAIYLSKICLNVISETDTQKIAGDCDANGVVDDFDVTLLMEFCIGLQKKLPVTD